MDKHTCRDCKETSELDCFGTCGHCGSSDTFPADDEPIEREQWTEQDWLDQKGCDDYHAMKDEEA